MFRQYRQFEKNEFIVVGADAAMGGSDYSASQFLSVTKRDVPLVWHANVTAEIMTDEIWPVLESIHDRTGYNPCIAYERNNGGVFQMDRLARLNKKNKFNLYKMEAYGRTEAPEAVKYGWDTNTATRPEMLSALQEAINKKLLKVYDKITIEEFFSFILNKTTVSEKAQAEVGAHDDLVMSLAIAWQLYHKCDKPDPGQDSVMEEVYYERLNDDGQ